MTDQRTLSGGIVVRPAVLADAGPLAAAYRHNREHLRVWEPIRPDSFFTEEGQSTRLQAQLAAYEVEHQMPWVLASGDRIVGTVSLNSIVKGAFRSATFGYWIDVDHNGRGLASSAVETIIDITSKKFELHRFEAQTLPENAGSQRVLEKCGFVKYGVAPDYLHINGRWRDHFLFQRIINDNAPPS